MTAWIMVSQVLLKRVKATFRPRPREPDLMLYSNSHQKNSQMIAA